MSYQEVTKDQLLASVNRRALDFDFEPQCSVTLSTKNIYVCLTCGKNFQGRAFNSPMHVHAVNCVHRLFMSLTDGKCVVMPDNVDVEMPDLDDIRRALLIRGPPLDLVEGEDSLVRMDAHEKAYICGFVGLNNPRRTHINVILQVMTHIAPLKQYYLKNIPTVTNKVETAFAEVVRRVWSPYLLKACISPHTFVQVSDSVSDKPSEFMAWFLNNLPKRIIDPIFQGHIIINTQLSEHANLQRTTRPFYMLTLELPPLPLFQDIVSRRTVPQVSIDSLLMKYTAGETTFKGTTATSYELVNLPDYLILSIPRITQSEYNSTVVIYPDTISPPHPLLRSRYILVASICVLVDTSIDTIANTRSTYTYTVFVLDEKTNKWWEMRDAEVKQLVSAEIVRMADTCLQVWRRIE